MGSAHSAAMGCNNSKAPARKPGSKATGVPNKTRNSLQANNQNWDVVMKPDVERIFNLADKDNNKFIDMAELANVRNSEAYAKIMMEHQDANKDGKLSIDEWSDY